jgi:uncharacterized protein (TIGR02145 family)
MKKEHSINIWKLIFIGFLSAFISNCKKDNIAETPNTITDIDGNVYHTVTIGTQVWMAENLKVTRYRNGDVIGTTTPAMLDISNETGPKYQWAYDGDENNVDTYGRLYTWYAINDSRNICPTGWHVPTFDEWTTLGNYLIANEYNYDGLLEGNKYAKSLASQSGWALSSIEGAIGNIDYPTKKNITGFTALPGGMRTNFSFEGIGSGGIWWSLTPDASYPVAHIFELFHSENDAKIQHNALMGYGLSMRCLRD